MCSLV